MLDRMKKNQSSIVFVTQNPHKLQDARKLLPHLHIEHVDFAVPEIQSLDVQEVAAYKLQYAFQKVRRPCFVMDAALGLDCVHGFPGPFIKFWFTQSVGAERTCAIAHALKTPECTWTTVLGYTDGEKNHYFKESIRGVVASTPLGSEGYDWDTIFIPEGQSKTLAQMSFDEKQSYAVTRKLLTQFDLFLSSL